MVPAAWSRSVPTRTARSRDRQTGSIRSLLKRRDCVGEGILSSPWIATTDYTAARIGIAGTCRSCYSTGWQSEPCFTSGQGTTEVSPDHGCRSTFDGNMKRQTPPWLETAIFYEVYPQSFCDSNGDGIGDLPGIVSKLDHILSLGCNAIWLNPCFSSPFRDAGYDVSDFYSVAPRYGSESDLIKLFEEAHARGMKVCLDLVPGHTSTDHHWFLNSARAEKNAMSNRYIWTSSVWEDAGNGLRAINGYSGRDGNYVANYFYFQPALNYGFAKPDPSKPWQLPVDHPDVLATRAEMIRIMRYWMDKGADGFRVDMASSLVKNDPGFVETMKLWNEVRAIFDRDYPDAVLISEWSNPSLAIKAGFHIDFLIHFNTRAYTPLFRNEPFRDCFGGAELYGPSYFDSRGEGDLGEFLGTYLEHYRATRELGYISIPSGNHDIVRLACGRTQEDLKVAFAFLLTMPGIACIYNGDEIGMAHVRGLASKEGGYGRTGARTPMQWDSSESAGFSIADAARFYLPLDPSPNRPNVAAQESDAASLLNFLRELTSLRQKHPSLRAGSGLTVLHDSNKGYPFVYLRHAGEQRIMVALNPSNRTVRATFPVSFPVSRIASLPISSHCHWEESPGHITVEMPPVSSAICTCE